MVLEGIWTFLTSNSTPIDWLESSTDQGLGTLYQVDHDRLRLSWVTDALPVHVCNICRRMAPVSVRGVCPALGCEGGLEEFVPQPVEKDRDHYRAVYRSMYPVPLRAKEHTAQWANTEAAAIQQQFVKVPTSGRGTTAQMELGSGSSPSLVQRPGPRQSGPTRASARALESGAEAPPYPRR